MEKKKITQKIWAAMLAFVMMFTMSNMAVFADGENQTLQQRINSAGKGDTVQLTSNVKEDIEIEAEKEIILDLNGYTLTNVENHTIHNKGKLTVIDSSKQKTGKVDNITHARAALYNDGEAVLNGGSFTRSQEKGSGSTVSGGNSYYTVLNHNTMEIHDGVTVTQSGQYSSLLENGWYNGNENKGGQNSKLTIYGGTFDGGLNTIKNDDYGELVIQGGKFENVSQAAVLNWNMADIKGGTFTSDKAGILNGYLNDSMDQGKLSVTGGSFTCGENNNIIERMGGSSKIGEVAVSGGVFSKAIAADYIAANMTSVSLETASDTKYYIGTAEDIAKTVMEKASEVNTIVVQQGNLKLEYVKEGIKVQNSGNGEVVVNNEKIANGEVTTKHQHKAVKTEAKAPTAAQAGNIEYWYCADCGKYFADAELTKEIKKEDTVIAATGTTKPTQKKPTYKKTSTRKIKVSWKKKSGAKGYVIYAKAGNGKYKKIKTVGKVTSKTVTVTSGASYKFKVKPYKNVKKKGKTVKKYYKAYKAKGKNGKKTVKVTYKNISGYEGYVVYVKVGKGSYKKVKTTKKGGTITYTNKNAKVGKSYTFKLQGYKTVKGKKVYTTIKVIK